MLSSELYFAVIGGILLSLSTSFHLLFKGRITGMSGIYYGLITNDPKSFSWKVLYVLVTMLITIIIWDIVGFEQISSDEPALFEHPSKLVKNLNVYGFFLAGLLIGLGSKLGNGCTSGHGVCGLPRFSKRSWVFVPIFVVMAISTATFQFYVPFLEGEASGLYDSKDYTSILSDSLMIVIWGLILYFFYFLSKFRKDELIDIVVIMITAILFTLGLIISGMNKRSKILGFLRINADWDPSLLLVLCSAVGFNFMTFFYIIKIKKTPIFAEKLEIPSNNVIDNKLIIGAILFGLGWGLGGLCPGPGFILFPFMTTHITLLWFLGLTIGQYAIKFLEIYEKHKEKTKVQEL